jgi:predicted transposase YbfD/YdcC
VRSWTSCCWRTRATALQGAEKKWFALDGKELRGSRAAGATRGAAVVRALAHDDQSCPGQAYYDGTRESELTTTQELLRGSEVAGQKVSFDALHCQVKTLELIVRAEGKYVVGVKGNQPELRRQLERVSQRTPCLYRGEEVEKGHGRLETRRYEFYDLLGVALDKRWQASQLRTCVKVQRTREELKTQKSSAEDSYYVTNEVGNYEEISAAIRQHWQIEADNYVRDVSLQEDALRAQSKGLQRVLAGARTVVLEVLKKLKCPNKKAQLEHFADNFEDLLQNLRALNFL